VPQMPELRKRILLVYRIACIERSFDVWETTSTLAYFVYVQGLCLGDWMTGLANYAPGRLRVMTLPNCTKFSFN
jgi:hypothetical protein